MHPTSYPTHIPFIPSESTLPFLSYSNFKNLPSKSKVKVMGEVWSQCHGWGSKSQCESNILSTHIPFAPWQSPIPFLRYYFFSKFDLGNPRSRSWKRWTLKVTTWVQHSIDSHPFCSMSISHPVHKIRLFQNLTLEIQGQDHGLSQSWKSQSGCNILSTHMPFVPCQSALPDFFKIWPSKSKVKVMGDVDIKSHNMSPTFYRLTSL